MNKKTQVFIIGTVLMVLAALIFAYVRLDYKYSFNRDTLSNPMGSKQESVVGAYQRAETVLLYIDNSAKLSAFESILGMAENGGVYRQYYDLEKMEEPPCGTYIYVLWNSKNKSCFPDPEENFKQFFNDNLNNYLSSYTEDPFIGTLPLDNYDISLEQKEDLLNIKGFALTELMISLAANEVKSKELILEQQKNFPAEEPPSKEAPQGLVDIRGITECKALHCLLVPEAAEKLQEAANIAQQRGETLIVNDAYRTYEEQKRLWDDGPSWYIGCWTCLTDKQKNKWVAYPGTSEHEKGKAVDVKLKTGVGSKLESIMCEADWTRYVNEGWHFEYQTKKWNIAHSNPDQKLCRV